MVAAIAKRASAVAGVGFVLAVLGTGSAFAATSDPDGGASTLAIDQLKTFMTGTLAIAFFALVVAGLGIAMGVKWLKKAQRQS